MTFEAGAVVTCVLGSAFHAIVTRGRAVQGETAVVTGAGGGVGMHALQILRSGGIRAIAVTSSPEKGVALRNAGADEVVVIKDGRYAAEVKALTSGVGADLVLEIAGGNGLLESIHAVRPQGRVVVLGNVRGGTVDLPPAYLILKEISLIGTKSISRHEMMTLLPRIARGILTPRVDRILRLEDAARAHKEMDEGDELGRTVLTVSS